MRIRWRITIPYVALIILMMLALGAYMLSFIRQSYINNLEAELKGEALLASDALAPLFTQGAGADQLDSLAHHWATVLGTRVTIIAADGTVVGESQEDRKLMENHLLRPEVQQALHSGVGASMRYSQTVGYDMLYVAVPVSVNQGQTAGFVRVALPLKQVQSNLAHIQATLLGATLLATILAIILAAWIAGRTTQPLRELTRAAARVSQGDLEGRILPTTNDEVGQLTQAFNRMASDLRNRIETLKSEQSKMAAVLEEMSDGVLIVDASGRIQLTNPAVETLFGLQAKQAIGHTVAEMLRNYQIVELWKRCRETGETQATLLELGPKHLYLQVVATPLGQSQPGSILLLIQNLTRIRHLETVRRDFVSNISHELRTPVASLKALTETLQSGALDDPPVARRFLERMETEVDALAMMIQELLELARIESGRVPLQLTATSPGEVIASAVERLRLQAERAGLRVQVQSPDNLPPVLADPVRLEQVLVNLIHNAIKFTSSGGQITVQAQQSGENVDFSIADTGVGIPPGDLPRIFERFYKSDRARSTGGTGLGLAIARHIVEAHAGRIWAQSVEGKGSTFTFTIPIEQ